MVKAIFSLISILILIPSVTVQANCLDEITAQPPPTFNYPPLEKPLVPAELPFIKYGEEGGMKIKWPKARAALWRNATKNLDKFTDIAYLNLHITLGNLDKLGIKELHRQYAELYELLSAPAPQPKLVMAVVAEQTSRSRSSSEDSSVDPSASSLSSSFAGSEDSDSSVSAVPQLAGADAGSDGPPLGSSASESGLAEFDDILTSNSDKLLEEEPLVGGPRRRLTRLKHSSIRDKWPRYRREMKMMARSSDCTLDSSFSEPTFKGVRTLEGFVRIPAVKQEENDASPAGGFFDMTDFFFSREASTPLP